MIKLLAVDMDGTCLNGRSRISGRTMAALKRAAAAGIRVVPTTGRSLSCLPYQLAEQKNLYDYVITSNGAEVIRCADRASVAHALISKDTALRILADCRHQRVGTASHIQHEYLLQGRGMAAMGYLIYGKDARGVRRVEDMAETIKTSPCEVEELQFFFYPGSSKAEMKRILAKYPEVEAAYTGMYVEIYSRKASKGRALASLAEHLQIRREEIACIGDGENDLSMFRVSGLRLAMGNACPKLKEEADYILPVNYRDGAAKGIEKYLGL